MDFLGFTCVSNSFCRWWNTLGKATSKNGKAWSVISYYYQYFSLENNGFFVSYLIQRQCRSWWTKARGSDSSRRIKLYQMQHAIGSEKCKKELHIGRGGDSFSFVPDSLTQYYYFLQILPPNSDGTSDELIRLKLWVINTNFKSFKFLKELFISIRHVWIIIPEYYNSLSY